VNSLDIGYEAAWFMSHRLREAMRDGALSLPRLRGHPVKVGHAALAICA
jgi:hypothetical protein